MGIYSPYATVIWDYINRGMPFGKEGSLKPDEVYAITDAVTPEMVRKTYHVGSPAEIAAKVRPFTEAGATRHAFADVSALLIAQDPTDAVEGMIEVSRLVKAGDALASAPGAAEDPGAGAAR